MIRARREPRPTGTTEVRWKSRPTWLSLSFITALIVLLFSVCLRAEQRFPPPDFEGGHQIPTTATPAARAFWFQYQDVAALAVSLGLSSWLVYRYRARKGLVALSLFSLAYFGFYRKGCVCAIGSIQNVTLALFDSTYAVPISVLAFFLLPLVFSLFFGRTFCAAVCPHGALQDLVALKPIKVPGWLEQGLSVFPFIYLGAGLLFAGTGSLFLFCQYDPFVPIFRMSGRTLMVLMGVALLILGVFVGRPYCRFLCPYGALLKLGAAVAKRHVRVTPDYCTQCRLCEASCPFGALREPQQRETGLTGLLSDRRRLILLLLMLPLLVAGGAYLGAKSSTAASAMHPTVALAKQFWLTRNEPPKTRVLSPDELALQRARQDPDRILVEARAIQRKFAVGSCLFGAWVGAVVGIKLISLSLHRRRTDYEPSRGDCFACARCFEFCPNELVRRGVAPSEIRNPENLNIEA